MLEFDTVIVGNSFIPPLPMVRSLPYPLTEADKEQLIAAKMPTVNALMSQLKLMDDVYWVSGLDDDVAISEEFEFLEAVEAAVWIELDPRVSYYGSSEGTTPCGDEPRPGDSTRHWECRVSLYASFEQSDLGYPSDYVTYSAVCESPL